MTARFAITQAVGVCLLAAAAYMGYPQLLYAGDPTRLTALIGAAALIGIAAEAFRFYRVTDHLIGSLPVYGLLGTVIGLSMVAHNSGGDFDAVLAGLATAFYTTAAGMIGAEYLKITRALS